MEFMEFFGGFLMDVWGSYVHVYTYPCTNLLLFASRFVVYFAARNYAGMLCIGVATSSSVTGPFKDIGAPLVYNKSEVINYSTHPVT